MHLDYQPFAVLFLENAGPAGIQPGIGPSVPLTIVIQATGKPGDIAAPGEIDPQIFYFGTGRSTGGIHENVVDHLLKSIEADNGAGIIRMENEESRVFDNRIVETLGVFVGKRPFDMIIDCLFDQG